MWVKIAGVILRNRILLSIIVVALTILFAFQASQVELAYDNPKFIPQDDPDFIAFREFKNTFGEDGNIIVVGIETDKINELNFFNTWYDITHNIEKRVGIINVLSIANLKNIKKSNEYVQFDNDSFLASRFSSVNIFNEKPQSQEELNEKLNQIKTLRFYDGLLFNKTSNFTLLAITLDRSILDTKARINFVNQLKNEIEEQCLQHDVITHFSGLPYIRTIMSQRIQSELLKFTLLSLLITGLILWFFFRSFSTLIFSLSIVITGVIWCLGILNLMGFKITIFIGLLPPVIVVIGIANCIYLLNKYHDEFRKHKNKVKALQRVIYNVGLAVFLTNLTTSIGFGVFYLTGSDALKEFGLTAFVSIMGLFFISIILMPVVFSFLPPPKHKHTKHLNYRFTNKLVGKMSRLVYRKRKWIYGTTIVLTVLSVIGASTLKSIGYMVDDIPKNDVVYQDLKFFEDQIKGVFPFEIVVDTKKENGVTELNNLMKIDLVERKLMQFDEFTPAMSIAKALKYLNQAYHNGDQRRYTTPSLMDLGEILNALPKEGENHDLVSKLIDSTNRLARVSVQMADIGSKKIKLLKREVEQLVDTALNFKINREWRETDSIEYIEQFDNFADTVYYGYEETTIIPVDSNEQLDFSITGTSIIFLKGNDFLISNLITSLIVSFLIISLLMWFVFRSGSMILISFIPNVIPLLFTAGVMGFAGVSFKPSTILVFSVAFGIAVDFSIHFLSKYKIELARQNDITKAVKSVQQEISTSMIYTAIILFFGFAIFTFSNFGGTVSLGLFTALTLIMAVISNLLILPSLLLSYELAKAKRKRRKVLKAKNKLS